MRPFFLQLSFALTPCQLKTDKHPFSDKTEEGPVSRKETQVFGDTLKVVYEYRGDTVIQHRIDLKGIADDGFDSSFNVTSVWSTKKAADLTCPQRLRIRQDGVDFYFCLDDAIQNVANDIKTSEAPGLEEGLANIKAELMNIKNGKADSLQTETYYLTFDLLRAIDFHIIDHKTKSKIGQVMIEHYETDFTAGRNYYLISDKKDTLARFDVNEWMR